MREENTGATVGLIVGLVIGVVAGLILGSTNGRDSFMIEAVKHGAAEWRVVDHTGRIEFHWIDLK